MKSCSENMQQIYRRTPMRFVISINLNCTLACPEQLFTKTHLEACFCINILPLHYFLTNVLGKMNEDFYVHLSQK